MDATLDAGFGLGRCARGCWWRELWSDDDACLREEDLRIEGAGWLESLYIGCCCLEREAGSDWSASSEYIGSHVSSRRSESSWLSIVFETWTPVPDELPSVTKEDRELFDGEWWLSRSIGTVLRGDVSGQCGVSER
jgi:hypothetical protein